MQSKLSKLITSNTFVSRSSAANEDTAPLYSSFSEMIHQTTTRMKTIDEKNRIPITKFGLNKAKSYSVLDSTSYHI